MNYLHRWCWLCQNLAWEHDFELGKYFFGALSHIPQWWWSKALSKDLPCCLPFLTTSLVWVKQHHHHHWHHHPHHHHFKDFPCLAFPWLPPCSQLSSPDRRKWVGPYAVCTLFVSSPEPSCWGHVSLIIVHHAIQRNGKAFALYIYLDAYLSEPACWGIYVLYLHLLQSYKNLKINFVFSYYNSVHFIFWLL